MSPYPPWNLHISIFPDLKKSPWEPLPHAAHCPSCAPVPGPSRPSRWHRSFRPGYAVDPRPTAEQPSHPPCGGAGWWVQRMTTWKSHPLVVSMVVWWSNLRQKATDANDQRLPKHLILDLFPQVRRQQSISHCTQGLRQRAMGSGNGF